MAGSTQSIKCMILTMRSENVIVPNNAIAEILAARDATPVEKMPSWYLGRMQWRGAEVPLVSYEAAGGESVKGLTLNTQVAMLYSLSKDAKHPYIGVVISGVPHEAIFYEDQIKIDEDATDALAHPMAAMKTRINGAAVSILDINAIESMIMGAEG